MTNNHDPFAGVVWQGKKMTSGLFSALSTEDKILFKKAILAYQYNTVSPHIHKRKPAFSKRHYVALAKICQEIRHQMDTLFIHRALADELSEMIIARMGMMLAEDNSLFDSFRFVATARAPIARRAKDASGKKVTAAVTAPRKRKAHHNRRTL